MTETHPQLQGTMRIPGTRTNTGRRIDTWTFTFPDDSLGPRTAEIEICLHSKGGEIRFTAQSTHPALRDQGWSDTDITALRGRIHADISSLIEARGGVVWTRGLMVEGTAHDRRGDTHTEVRFDLRISSVRYDPTPTDAGHIRVQPESGKVHDIIPRRASQDIAPASRNLAEMSGDAFQRMSDTPAGRQVLADTDAAREMRDALVTALTRFTRALADRLGPSEDGVPQDLPSPAELVDMMDAAAAQASVPLEDDDSIRI